MYYKKILFIISFLISLITFNFSLKAEWSSPDQISDGIANLNPSYPLAIDNSSRALVGWLDGDLGVGQTLYSSNLFPTSSFWTDPQVIFSNTTIGSAPTFPTFAIDIFGDQIAAYGVVDGIIGSFTLNAQRRQMGMTTWQDPIMQLLSGVPSAGSVSAGKFGGISALLALSSTGTPPFDITFVQLLPNDSFWLPPIVLGQDNSFQPVVATNPDHNFSFVAWKTNIPTLRIETFRFAIASQQLLPSMDIPLPPSTTDILFIQLTVDDNENVIAIYVPVVGGKALLYSSTLFSGQTTWTSPLLISDPSNNVIGAFLDSDDAGTATILWGEEITPTQEFLRAATLPLGGTPTLITNLTSPSNLNTTISGYLSVSVDAFGNAVAIWNITTGGISMIQTSSKALNQDWTSAETLSLTGKTPFIVLSDQGTAVAVWVDSITNVLMGSRNLTLFPLAPPSDFNGTIVENISPEGNTFSLVMNWLPSPAPNIDRYEIFSDGVLIGTVSNNGPYTFTTQLQSNSISNIYTLVAVASNSNRSLPITLNLIPTLPPPSNFIGTVKKNEFLTQTTYFLKMQWDPSPGENISYYQIFKNGRLIATIVSNDPLIYLEPLHSKKVKGEYLIRAVGTNGSTSFAVPLVVKK